MKWKNKIFQNHTNNSFEALALEVFLYQAKNNNVYKTYLKLLNVSPNNVKNLGNFKPNNIAIIDSLWNFKQGPIKSALKFKESLEAKWKSLLI